MEAPIPLTRHSEALRDLALQLQAPSEEMQGATKTSVSPSAPPPKPPMSVVPSSIHFWSAILSSPQSASFLDTPAPWCPGEFLSFPVLSGVTVAWTPPSRTLQARWRTWPSGSRRPRRPLPRRSGSYGSCSGPRPKRRTGPGERMVGGPRPKRRRTAECIAE